MPEGPMWMVRADVGGRLFEDFQEKSVVAMGWGEIGDLQRFKDRQAIIDRVRRS